ncbi:MAG TPA: ABC transporter permease [Chloroflexota bacterium]|nr:ABC transporter permease [Chloroflexota bacterium]
MADSVVALPGSPERTVVGRLGRPDLGLDLLASGALLGAILLLALVGPSLTLYDPDAVDVLAAMRPLGAPGHPLGTDQLGRDVLSRILVAVRTSVFFGVWPALVVVLLSTVVGLVAGYVGGFLDGLVMRALDVLLAFPFFILAIALVTYLGPSLQNAMIALIVVNLPGNVRVIRSVVLSARERPYVEAARILGYGRLRIIFGELLPAVVPNVITLAALDAAHMIAAGSALSFLGLGAQPPTADLGSMVNEARAYLRTQPALTLIPIAVLGAITFSMFAFTDAVQRKLAEG